MPPPIYHETQNRWLCAKLQRSVFSPNDLDSIANELAARTRSIQGFSWSNPHKSRWGLGNYDVNVLTLALETQGCTLSWLPANADVRDLELLKIVGLILNVQPRHFWNTAHWFAVRAINGQYYNLDSKLSQPVVVGSASELGDFLEQTRAEGGHIFVVKSLSTGVLKINKEVEREGKVGGAPRELI
ncbi:Josephin-1 [Dimargaris verticillata]|uniref:ubiquitinyl hydrolase 1 n=1 Tax=Dimargaris verticillata TaxID=2761393 RepID=A0A9W8BA87_9FUNG|nr:Josephin-1 [Dimargaris verticillata]